MSLAPSGPAIRRLRVDVAAVGEKEIAQLHLDVGGSRDCGAWACSPQDSAMQSQKSADDPHGWLHHPSP